MRTPVKIPSWILSSVGLFLTGLLLAGAMGGITNSINGWINPLYVVAVMRWQSMDDVWWAGVAEGVASGVMRGFVLCAIFTLGIALISRGECPLSLSLRYLFTIFGSVSVCWTVGGLFSVVLSLLFPQFYRFFFFGMPNEVGDVIRYAWVGGSIWGAQLGGVGSVFVALARFNTRWKRRF
ncbi:hypothetical protein IAD21_01924 [Abditibacteriota bacterium]|nr:hypothetical protein IAD21_01924 [Abditibacteriota bacterium]